MLLGTLTPTPTPTPISQSSFRRTLVCSAVTEAAPNNSLYEVLRVKPNASQIEIKTAYRTLAKLYHPDATSRFLDSSIASSSIDGRDFIEIHNAYATLSDPDARAVYDSNFVVNSRRCWNTAGLQSPARRRFYPNRRWETDQCW